MIDSQQLVVFFLVLARVASFIAFFPLFSKRQLPILVKVGLAVSLSIFWSLGNTSGQHANISLMLLFFLTLKEVTIGVILGMMMGLMLWPARIAGAYVGQELGLSLASISDPGSQDSSTLVTRIFEVFAILVFFVGNIHHFAILVLHHSFGSFGHDLESIDLTSKPLAYAAELMNDVSDQGLMIAGPLLILFMMVTLVLAYLNRAAPSLNLFSVGMSIRAGLGILCLFLFAPVVLTAIHHHLLRNQESLAALVQLFSV